MGTPHLREIFGVLHVAVEKLHATFLKATQGEFAPRTAQVVKGDQFVIGPAAFPREGEVRSHETGTPGDQDSAQWTLPGVRSALIIRELKRPVDGQGVVSRAARKRSGG